MTAARIPFYPQLDDKDCGATCLRMVAKYYGVSANMQQLRKLTNTTNSGVSLADIQSAAEQLGFETIAAELPYFQLEKGDLLPVILHWDSDHFVVVSEVNTEQATVYDPAHGVVTYTRNEFEAKRYGGERSQAGLILRPGANIASLTKDEHHSAIIDEREVGLFANFSAPIVWSSLFFAVAMAIGGYVAYSSLKQAIDLQYMEGLVFYLGACMLAGSGIALSYYFLRKQSVEIATQKGTKEVDALLAKIQSQTVHRRDPSALTTAHLQMLEDIDGLRVWRAYRFSSLISACIVALVALGWLFYVDWLWAIVSLLLLSITVFVMFKYLGWGEADVLKGKKAQLQQRKSIYSYSATLSDLKDLKADEFLTLKMLKLNENVNSTFQEVASSFSINKQIKEFLIILICIALIVFGVYRLGHSSLQIGEAWFGFLLLVAITIAVLSARLSYLKWQNLNASRLRIFELLSPVIENQSLKEVKPNELTIEWTSSENEPQIVSFPAIARVALKGNDIEYRKLILDGIRGIKNKSQTTLYADTIPISISQLGKTAYISPDSVLLEGTIIENITLSSDHIDEDKLKYAVDLVELESRFLKERLNFRIEYDSTGVSKVEKLKILLARAVYNDVDVIIIDQATNILPAYEEGLLMDNLLQWAAYRLLIINSSRPNTSHGCDLLFYVENSEMEQIRINDRVIPEGAVKTKDGVEII